jgi:hypothetical protein
MHACGRACGVAGSSLARTERPEVASRPNAPFFASPASRAARDSHRAALLAGTRFQPAGAKGVGGTNSFAVASFLT